MLYCLNKNISYHWIPLDLHLISLIHHQSVNAVKRCWAFLHINQLVFINPT